MKVGGRIPGWFSFSIGSGTKGGRKGRKRRHVPAIDAYGRTRSRKGQLHKRRRGGYWRRRTRDHWGML